jgi:hypothetical protein
VIDYEQVQARVKAKYDSWQRDILSRFGVKSRNAMNEMHASIIAFYYLPLSVCSDSHNYFIPVVHYNFLYFSPSLSFPLEYVHMPSTFFHPHVFPHLMTTSRSSI